MRLVVTALCLLPLLAGCAAGDPDPPHYAGSDGALAPDGKQDLAQQVDTYPPLLDSAADPDGSPPVPDAPACALGTVNNCSKCGDVCAGKGLKNTVRVCQKGVCGIQCEGEYYDVDGQLSTGCELSDDTPVHENKYVAASMGKVDDCAKTKTTSAVMPSDNRMHTKAPTLRPNGREDWFKLYIKDTTWCLTEARVDVKLSGLSASAAFKVEAYFLCDANSTATKTISKTGYGGNTFTLIPSTACTTGSMGNDSGSVYIRVVKTSGPHSSGKYTVEVMP